MSESQRATQLHAASPRIVVHPSRHEFTAQRERRRKRLQFLIFAGLAALLLIEIVEALRLH